MNAWRKLGMITVCVFFAGSTNVFADDAAQPAATPVPANVQVASVAPFAASVQRKVSDPLHADPRWPQFKNCIDNTSTPDAFQACLQMAFLGATPNDHVLALLTR